MSNSFGATSTTDEVLRGINLSGKRVLVTGVSAGLGVETARALAAHGAEVIGAARDLSKAQAATEQVRAQAAGGGSLRSGPARPGIARQCAPLRRRSACRGQAFRRDHCQRRCHGVPQGHHGRWL